MAGFQYDISSSSSEGTGNWSPLKILPEGLNKCYDFIQYSPFFERATPVLSCLGQSAPKCPSGFKWEKDEWKASEDKGHLWKSVSTLLFSIPSDSIHFTVVHPWADGHVYRKGI